MRRPQWVCACSDRPPRAGSGRPGHGRARVRMQMAVTLAGKISFSVQSLAFVASRPSDDVTRFYAGEHI